MIALCTMNTFDVLERKMGGMDDGDLWRVTKTEIMIQVNEFNSLKCLLMGFSALFQCNIILSSPQLHFIILSHINKGL